MVDDDKHSGSVRAQIASTLVAAQRLRLPSGHVVEADTHIGGERLQVRAASGEIVITVELTERGPVVRLTAAALEVAAGALSIDCETLKLRARDGAAIEVGGPAQLSAESVALEARSGNVDLRANDDVDVRGERIRLNCDDAPMPLTWEEFSARHGTEPPAKGSTPDGGAP